jgi:outer membrane biosynthesis protein TonB
MRRWLVIPSIAVHVGLIVALLFLGAWHLDKLDAGRREINIGYVPQPPPAPEGSPAPKKATPFQHKKPPITHDLVVPPENPAKPDPTPAVADPNDGNGNGLGSGSGSGSGEGPGSGDGPCTIDCGPPVVEAKAEPPKKVDLLPTVLNGLRISGDTQFQPSGATKSDMQFHQVDKLRATFQVCLDTSGNVSSARELHPTGYAEYDDTLKAGIATWRYRPYMVGGQGIPACGIVSFVYTMR